MIYWMPSNCMRHSTTYTDIVRPHGANFQWDEYAWGAAVVTTDSSAQQVSTSPRASRQPQRRERPTAASRSASQPIAAPSAKEVYLDSDSDLLLLTTWAGRPAASLVPPAYAFARRTPILTPPDLPVSPPSRLHALRLARSQSHCPRLVLWPVLTPR